MFARSWQEVAGRVRQAVLKLAHRMGHEVAAETPDAFAVRVAQRFAANHRAQKIPCLVHDIPLEQESVSC